MKKDIFWDLLLETDQAEFIELRPDYDNASMTAKMLHLYDYSIIYKYEKCDSDIDDRVFTLFMLVSGHHPLYKLHHRSDKDGVKSVIKFGDYDDELVVNKPTGEEVRDLRKSVGLNQTDFGSIFGKLSKSDISKIENNYSSMDTISNKAWSLALLATDSHPYYYVCKK